MRWHYRDPLLVWLFPASYAAHVVEEWLGGFPEWLAVFGREGLPRGAFVAINGVAMTLMIVATHLVTRAERKSRAMAEDDGHGWIAVAIATILLVNGLMHIGASLLTATYSPGLFTSMVLYLPIAQLALFRAWQQAPRRAFLRGTCAGVAMHALVSGIAIALASTS